VAVLIAAIVVRTRRQAIAGNGRPRVRMWDGFTFVCADRVLRPLLTSLIVFVLLGGVVNVVDVFLVRNTFGAPDGWYGAVVALWMAGMVAGSLLAGRLRGDSAGSRAALGGAAIISVALGAIAAVPSVGWLAPLELAGGFGNGLLNVAVGALLLTRTPEAIRGRVSAAVNGAANAAALGALALGGAFAALLAPRTIFLIAGAGGALCVAAAAIPLTRAVGHRTPHRYPAGPSRPEPPPRHIPKKDGIHHAHVRTNAQDSARGTPGAGTTAP
jgi:MFS family permease